MKQGYNPKNANILININGELFPRDKAGISPFDSAVQNGDAVWEGLRVYDGRIFKLIEHLDRLHDSAQALAYNEIPSRDTLIDEIRKTLVANEMYDNVHIRLTLTRGVKYTSGMDPRLNTSAPTLIVLPEFKAPVYDKSGLSLITSSIRRIPPDCLDQNIHSCNMINSVLAKLQANLANVDDALMLDTDGFVAETNATHIFLVRRGVVLTPRTTSCPKGITRMTVLDLCRQHDIPHEVRDLSLTEVYTADEMFCTGTMGELAAVTCVDGRTIGSGQVGAMTEHLSALYTELTRTEGMRIIP